MRAALLDWHLHVNSGMRAELRSLRNRLLLGQPTAQAVAHLRGGLEEDAPALSAAVAVHGRCGGDANRIVESLANSIQRRHESFATAAAHGSGVKLSARMIAGLPLAFIPMAPMTKAPIGDGAGIFLIVIGVALAVVGMAWISALFPKPEPHDDPGAAMAELLAAGVDGGADLRSVLAAVCAQPMPGVGEAANRIRRLLVLGAGSTEALLRSGHASITSLGRSLDAVSALGLSTSSVLRNVAAARRAERERAFEAAVKRAPVRMAVPLAVCVLPSFVVLGIAPFLRGLSLGA
jgi:tight adherence protein B